MIYVHLVFLTKSRREVYTKDILKNLREIFASICQGFGATLVEFEEEDDPVHLLVRYSPKISVFALVNCLGGVLS